MVKHFYAKFLIKNRRTQTPLKNPTTAGVGTNQTKYAVRCCIGLGYFSGIFSHSCCIN